MADITRKPHHKTFGVKCIICQHEYIVLTLSFQDHFLINSYFAEYSTNGTSFTPIIGSLGSPRHVAIVSDMIGTDVHLRIYQNIGGQKLYSDTVILTISDLVPPANFAISQNADTLELSWDPTLARKYIIRGDGLSEPVPYGTNSFLIPITEDMRGETVEYTIQSQFREHRSAASSASIAIP